MTKKVERSENSAPEQNELGRAYLELKQRYDDLVGNNLAGVFQTTADHVAQTLDWLRHHPGIGSHLEMETYTWEVLPQEMRSGDVVDQLVREYEWALGEMRSRELSPV